MDLDRDDYAQAKDHLDSGLQIARNIGLVEEVAKLHLTSARLHFAQDDLPQANAALSETLSICTRCGYKLIEIDALNIHAQILNAEGKTTDARTKAQTALSMSKDCGYYWGKVDAEEILNKE